MDREYTVRINGDDVTVTVRQIAFDEWRASAEYQGTHYEASGDSAASALEMLSGMLRS